MKEQIQKMFNPDEMQALVKKEFEKFYLDSPFKFSGETTKTAMNGSYYAGFNLAQERLIQKLLESLPN